VRILGCPRSVICDLLRAVGRRSCDAAHASKELETEANKAKIIPDDGVLPQFTASGRLRENRVRRCGVKDGGAIHDILSEDCLSRAPDE